MSTKSSKITMSVPAAKHRQFKKTASNMGITMKDLFIIIYDQFMDRKPNKETEKAIKQALEGKGMKTFENIEDLFKDLGI